MKRVVIGRGQTGDDGLAAVTLNRGADHVAELADHVIAGQPVRVRKPDRDDRLDEVRLRPAGGPEISTAAGGLGVAGGLALVLIRISRELVRLDLEARLQQADVRRERDKPTRRWSKRTFRAAFSLSKSFCPPLAIALFVPACQLPAPAAAGVYAMVDAPLMSGGTPPPCIGAKSDCSRSGR
jgi:hypothetical protein